jgi:hypothetical protein
MLESGAGLSETARLASYARLVFRSAAPDVPEHRRETYRSCVPDEDQSSFRSNNNCAKRGANHARDAPKADHYFRTPKKVFRPIITAASTGGVYRQACNARLQFPQAANKCRSVDDQCGTNANAVGLPLSAFQNYGTR